MSALLPDFIPTEIRRLTSGTGPWVVRGRTDIGRVTFWLDGRGDTVEQARQRCDRLVQLLCSDPERYR